MITVLFVDDEPAFLDIGKQFLERSGDLVVTAVTSGKDALLQLEARRYDAVVSDYLMPEMDGIGLLKEIRSQYPGTMFIFLTGRGNENVAMQAINNGADHYLHKSDNPRETFAELEYEIRKVLGRRMADVLLGQSEQLFPALFQMIPAAAIFSAFSDGKCIDANDAYLRLVGYSRDELVGKTTVELNIWSSPEERQRVVADLAKYGQLENIELTIRRKDGQLINTLAGGKIITVEGARYILSFFVDITERRRDQEAFGQRAAQAVQYQKALVELATTDAPTLRSALNRITETGSNVLEVERVSLWFLTTGGEKLICNDLYIRGRGIHESGMELSREIHPGFFTALQECRTIVADDARTHERTPEFAESYLESQGIVSMLNVPVRSGKTVIGVLCFEQTGSVRTWDISDQDFATAVADYTAIVLEQARRRLVEKDLKKSEEKYRAVVDRANDGIVIIQDGLLRFVNPKAADIFGAATEDLLGKPFTLLLVPSERDKVSERYQRRMNGEDIPQVYETTLLTARSYPVDVELNAGTIMFEGKPSDLVFIRDISDRKRSEQALRLANQKLNLLSGVTRHDILNKLTIVIGYLELAKLSHDREKMEDFIRKIDTNLQVIEEQLQFTRDYQDMGIKDPEWQDAAKVFNRALSHLDAGSVQITNRLSGLWIFSDPLLEKVLYNIVDNSLRYGEKVTIISASVRQQNGEAVLVIEDDGVGIPVKDKGRIFERGFGHHTGLGLFLAKEILSLTGITIMETGFPQKGARFEIWIPAGRFRIMVQEETAAP